MSKLQVESPSNIALIKYWGKFGNQLPCNPSISFTLKNAKTTTVFETAPKNKNELVDLEFAFEGNANIKFEEKIVTFLTNNQNDFKNILNSKIRISSSNSFPHSSGIASSASSMSALVLGLLVLDQNEQGREVNLSDENFLKNVSKLSRIASGSASRSLFRKLAMWGEFNSDSSNEWANAMENAVDARFHEFCDSIVIVSKKEKSVSSRAGHELMNHHPYREMRFLEAKKRLSKLLLAMKNYDLEKFIEIVEIEALDLHSLMMTSTPSFILMEPKTLEIINSIRKFRTETKIPVCFTLDAGPNVHVLYPKEFKDQVVPLLSSFKLDVIHDEVGDGAMFKWLP